MRWAHTSSPATTTATTPPTRSRLESPSFAIRTEEIDLGADDVDWAPEEILGDVRIRVTSEKPVFVGIGPDGAVAAYLRGVGQDELTDLDDDPPELTGTPGGPPRRPPGDLRFWAAQASGAGEQELNWDADFGRWSAVVMNADGSRGIDVEADAGVKIGWVIWVGLGLLIVGADHRRCRDRADAADRQGRRARCSDDELASTGEGPAEAEPFPGLPTVRGQPLATATPSAAQFEVPSRRF